MQTFYLADDPWRRLPWLTGPAIALTTLALMGFVRLLEQAPATPDVSRSVEVQVVEFPAAVSAPRSAPSPPAPAMPQKPARVRPPELVRPRPEPKPVPPPAAPEPEPVAKPSLESAAPEPPQPAAPTAAVESSTAPSAAQSPSGAAQSVNAPSAAQTSPSDRPMTAAIPPQGSPGGVGLGGGRMSARAMFQPLPQIPEDLRRDNLELVAVARFRVAANGTAAVELVQPTPHAELNRSLLEALKRWRFFPAMQDGKAVASTVDIRIPISVK
jgi:periplasmic protein TonB